LPTSGQGGFWLGGLSTGVSDEGAYLFNGWIDEVRYQSFNPLSAGAFNPTAFLIRDPAGPGDFNDDGAVDAADYVVWRKTDGSQGTYDAWRTNFGDTAGGASLTMRAVPEPQALLIFAGALFAAVPYRRRTAD
jgi:hypothetical protein